MVTRVLCAVAVLTFGAWAGADEPKEADEKVEEIKKALVGKWQSDDKDKAPVEFKVDGTMKYAWFKGNGNWEITDGTYTVSADGLVKYTTTNGGAKLSGWFRYKDGVLTSPRGPAPLVTWSKIEEKKPAEKK